MKRIGFTLLEVVFASAVVVIVIMALTTLYHHVQISERENQHTQQALILAQSLMEEIRSQSYEESGIVTPYVNGLDAGEDAQDRTAYDDVDDYDDYGPYSPPLDVDGNPMNQYARFTQYVTVDNVADISFAQPIRASYASVGDSSTDFKKVTVIYSWVAEKAGSTMMATLSYIAAKKK